MFNPTIIKEEIGTKYLPILNNLKAISSIIRNISCILLFLISIEKRILFQREKSIIMCMIKDTQSMVFYRSYLIQYKEIGVISI